MDKMELKALGKINLGLDVLGRRENGYHDVRMVMQTVYLYDQIRIEKTKKPGIELSTNLFYLPVNENNLAYQAADLLMKEFDVKEGFGGIAMGAFTSSDTNYGNYCKAPFSSGTRISTPAR